MNSADCPFNQLHCRETLVESFLILKCEAETVGLTLLPPSLDEYPAEAAIRAARTSCVDGRIHGNQFWWYILRFQTPDREGILQRLECLVDIAIALVSWAIPVDPLYKFRATKGYAKSVGIIG